MDTTYGELERGIRERNIQKVHVRWVCRGFAGLLLLDGAAFEACQQLALDVFAGVLERRAGGSRLDDNLR